MVRTFAVALWLAVVGCDLGSGPEAPEPVVYVVQTGDTLFLIGKAHGVSAEDLRAWNGIEGDLIEVGQELKIYPGEPPAPKTAAKRRPRGAPSAGGAPEGTADDAPALVMPPEKPCLTGPSADALAEEGMAASQGLSEEQIRAGMSGFLPHTLTCFAGSDAAGALDLEITVACTGRVADVRVLDRGAWDDEVARCVADTLRYAPFPAHDLPDGETFRFPLRYSPG